MSRSYDFVSINIAKHFDINVNVNQFISLGKNETEKDASESEELKKYKLLYRAAIARNKSLNGRRKTRNEVLEEKKTKRNLREAKLKQEVEFEKERVKTEQAKTSEQRKLYAAERSKNFKLRRQLKTACSEKTKGRIAKEAVKTFVEKNFKGRATKTMLLNPEKKWARCDRDDIVEALAIRTLSPKTFAYLQKNGSLHMPSRRTIERHIEKISTCKPG